MNHDDAMDDMRKRLVDWYDAAARIHNQYFGHRFTDPIADMLRSVLQAAMSDCGLAEHFAVRVRIRNEGHDVDAMPLPISMLAHRYVALVKARGFKTLAPPTLRVEA